MQKRRDWPARMLTGEGWHGVEEYRQALNDAPRVPGDKRRRPWGPGETRILLDRLTQAKLMCYDPDNDRWREPRNPLRPPVDPSVSARHNARNRARYRAKTEAERAHAESLECLYGPICDPTHHVSDLKTPSESGYNASQSNSPEVYNTEAKSNHSAKHAFKRAQPSASADDLVMSARAEEVAGHPGNTAEPSCGAPPDPAPRQALEAQYRALGMALRQFDADDAAWVARWQDTHRGLPDEQNVMARRHRRWRASVEPVSRATHGRAAPEQSPGQPAPRVQKSADFEQIAEIVFNKPDFFDTSPRPETPKEPLRAQRVTELRTQRAYILDTCQRARVGHAPTRRLADIDTLLCALGDKAATEGELHTFCQNRPWAGTLTIESARRVGGSIGLWAYIARRMELKGEHVPSLICRNPTAVLAWRVRAWQRAQADVKGPPRRALFDQAADAAAPAPRDTPAVACV